MPVKLIVVEKETVGDSDGVTELVGVKLPVTLLVAVRVAEKEIVGVNEIATDAEPVRVGVKEPLDVRVGATLVDGVKEGVVVHVIVILPVIDDDGVRDCVGVNVAVVVWAAVRGTPVPTSRKRPRSQRYRFTGRPNEEFMRLREQREARVSRKRVEVDGTETAKNQGTTFEVGDPSISLGNPRCSSLRYEDLCMQCC